MPCADTTILFETIPTVEHLVNDVYHAEQKRKLKLIDSRSLKPDGISQHSAKNLLDCIWSIENKTFDAESVHYSMKEVAGISYRPGSMYCQISPLKFTQ